MSEVSKLDPESDLSKRFKYAQEVLTQGRGKTPSKPEKVTKGRNSTIIATSSASVREP